MDGLTPIPGEFTQASFMPTMRPLVARRQDFAVSQRDDTAPVWRSSRRFLLRRMAMLAGSILLTAGVGLALRDWLGQGDLRWIEGVLISLVCLTCFWIAFSVCTAALGLSALARVDMPARRLKNPAPLKVGLLMPIYHEDAGAVMGNAAAMLQDLADSPTGHEFELFILSDSRDAHAAAAESQSFHLLCADAPLPVWYRRRQDNTDRKVGNLSDWLANWGGAYDAMIVLDADSLMSADALVALADEMAADPTAGLIQSLPRLIGARTLFARLQQFSSAAYGWLHAEGLAAWSGSEGNYWGHNAILRTSAFAQCAHLPRLGRGGGTLILSHDFVEAGLLRRGGWAVRFLPRIGGSYEECPASLVDYALRDRRWCHGNLQHLRLLTAKGFHPVTRFHLFSGAMAYLMAPSWFALLLIWTLLGTGETANVIHYFHPSNPLMPQWPEITAPLGFGMLAAMYLMLLAPKLMAAMALAFSGTGMTTFGGTGRFWRSFLSEIAASVILAPIFMVQNLIAILRSTFGLSGAWHPQRRAGERVPMVALLRFHALETIMGAALVTGMATGLVSLWLAPIGLSLVLAAPLSWLTAWDLGNSRRGGRWLQTPEMTEEPKIMALARAWRERMRKAGSGGLGEAG